MAPAASVSLGYPAATGVRSGLPVMSQVSAPTGSPPAPAPTVRAGRCPARGRGCDAVTTTLSVTQDCTADEATSTGDSRKLSTRLVWNVSAPGPWGERLQTRTAGCGPRFGAPVQQEGSLGELGGARAAAIVLPPS